MHETIRRALGAISLACVLAVNGAQADTFLIDDTTAGTVYDGILDGFPFPPPGLAPDGAGDFTGNALAVAVQTGVTEERAIVELPLAALAGLTSADLDTAVLTFNIDDVVATFGPGTSFDGTAAATIVLFRYSGNGAIDLADFGQVAGAPLAVVSTTAFGTITDATLAVSGPLQFNVDVKAALGALLDGSATHMGVVFTTNDAASATSIDNLGAGGAGPAGVGGAALPFLTVTTVPNEPPVWDKDHQGCQAAVAKGGVKLSATLHKELSKCFNAVLKAAGAGDPLTGAAAKCTATLDPTNPESKVGKAIVKLQSGIATKCADLTPASIGSPCDGAATTFAETATCVASASVDKTSELVVAQYSPACALITAVGLEADYPALCAN